MYYPFRLDFHYQNSRNVLIMIRINNNSLHFLTPPEIHPYCQNGIPPFFLSSSLSSISIKVDKPIILPYSLKNIKILLFIKTTNFKQNNCVQFLVYPTKIRCVIVLKPIYQSNYLIAKREP